jgi:hypothetical protein
VNQLKTARGRIVTEAAQRVAESDLYRAHYELVQIVDYLRIRYPVELELLSMAEQALGSLADGLSAVRGCSEETLLEIRGL